MFRLWSSKILLFKDTEQNCKLQLLKWRFIEYFALATHYSFLYNETEAFLGFQLLRSITKEEKN